MIEIEAPGTYTVALPANVKRVARTVLENICFHTDCSAGAYDEKLGTWTVTFEDFAQSAVNDLRLIASFPGVVVERVS